MLSPAESDGFMTWVDGERIGAFWCRIPSLPNFGDALTPWLIRHLTGKYPAFVPPDSSRRKYFVVGSIMAYTTKSCTVWGSGILTKQDPICPEAELLSVRGPITRQRALQCGATCPEIYGDPALLLPMLYSPVTERTSRMGLIPHFSDKPRITASLRPADIKLIDVQDSIESVIEQIVSCEFIASSSLHGIITSHAYGIPAVWVQFRPLPGGDGVKFHDYFLSIGKHNPTPVPVEYNRLNVAQLAERAALPLSIIDTQALLNACPFRLAHESRNTI